MVKKKIADKPTKQVRLYPKECGVLWRIASTPRLQRLFVN